MQVLAYAKKVLKDANARLAAGEDILNGASPHSVNEKIKMIGQIMANLTRMLRGKRQTFQDPDHIDLPEGFGVGACFSIFLEYSKLNF